MNRQRHASDSIRLKQAQQVGGSAGGTSRVRPSIFPQSHFRESVSTPHNPHYVACFWQLLHRSIVASFSIGCYKGFEVQTARRPNSKPEREALEELIGAQALSADLKTAIVACLTGAESRRWTIAELSGRLNNLGVHCSKPAVSGALGELALEISLCPFLPWTWSNTEPSGASRQRAIFSNSFPESASYPAFPRAL